MSKELWDKGLAVRKEVLGAEYVERNLASADDFNMPMQELVTQSCWGWLWARPQMPRKMRSLINLAILSALNRPHEFRRTRRARSPTAARAKKSARSCFRWRCTAACLRVSRRLSSPRGDEGMRAGKTVMSGS